MKKPSRPAPKRAAKKAAEPPAPEPRVNAGRYKVTKVPKDETPSAPRVGGFGSSWRPQDVGND